MQFGLGFALGVLTSAVVVSAVLFGMHVRVRREDREILIEILQKVEEKPKKKKSK